MSVKSEAIRTIRGGQRFLSDMPFPRLQETRVLTSAVHKGRFEVTALPRKSVGCRAFFAADIPGLNTMTRGRGELPLLAPGIVRYRGEPLAVICAENAAALDAYCGAVRIEYAAQLPVLDLQAASDLVPGESLSHNEGQIAWGRSKLTTVAGEYEAGFQEFRFSEPQSAVALREKNLLTVYCSTRNPFHVRNNISLVLGLPEERICLIVPDSVEDPGDKETLPAIVASLAALIAFTTGRPARVTLDNTIKRMPVLVRLESGIGPDGVLAGTRAELDFDSGCCGLHSPNLFRRAVYTLPGPYRHNGLTVRGRAVLTDTMPYTRLLSGGAAEACFAIETHMTRLARAAGLDPFSFRKANVARPAGTQGAADRPTTAERVIDEATRLSDFKRKYAAFEALRQSSQLTQPPAGAERSRGAGKPLVREPSRHNIPRVPSAAETQGRPFDGVHPERSRGAQGRQGARTGVESAFDLMMPARGIGSALAFYGFDFIEENEDRERHAVTLTLEKDGCLRILTSAMETSQALRRLFTVIAARTLEIDPEDIVIESTDTARVPDSGPMYETHALTSIGKLIEQGCRSLKTKRGKTRKAVSVTKADASPAAHRTRLRPVYHPNDEAGLSWSATVVEVEIDPAAFLVCVTGIWSAIECGNILNRGIAVAQAEREIIRALDAAEESASGHGHKFRVRRRMPRITVSFVEIPYAHGPLGAKGIGELPGLGVAPAYAAAVSQALGHGVDFFPVSPLRLEGLVEET
ncbi:MAG: xanthine dehydrogenase family protein [Spirochaetales bacterium]|nr:xanthine dehydrogenase family protein [Spirochaetales bacterium]